MFDQFKASRNALLFGAILFYHARCCNNELSADGREISTYSQKMYFWTGMFGHKRSQKKFLIESCFSKSIEIRMSTCDRLCSTYFFLHVHVIWVDNVRLQNNQQAGTVE